MLLWYKTQVPIQFVETRSSSPVQSVNLFFCFGENLRSFFETTKEISFIRVSSIICLELCTGNAFKNFPPKLKLKLLNTFFNFLIWTISLIFLKIGKNMHTKINFVVKLKKKNLTIKTEKARFQIQLVYIQSNRHRFQFSPKTTEWIKARRITKWAKHFSDPEQKHMISTICVF